MNRYPVWKYLMIGIVLLVAALYTVPNFFGEAPAVQVSSGKSTVKVDATTLTRVQGALASAKIETDGVVWEGSSVRARFKDADTQIKAKDAISAALSGGAGEDDYVVALNLLTNSPKWMQRVGANPMFLGLDLRGGVHFLMQVDMKAAVKKRFDSIATDLRSALRGKNIRHAGISAAGDVVNVRFTEAAGVAAAKALVADQYPDLVATETTEGTSYVLRVAIKPEALRSVMDQALKQNISTLGNRINQLGVTEPVIQQQGADRIVIQLPGVQDVARAKEIIGRAALLEVRMVDTTATPGGEVPFGSEKFFERTREGQLREVVVRRQVVLTGDRINGAASTFDDKQRAVVSVDLDAVGGRIMQETTRENIGKPMAMVLFEKTKSGQLRGDVISVANIQGEFGSRFQISGNFSAEETNNLSLLMRAGSLAAPMEFIEERTIGPSLGAENIEAGFNSVTWGFLVIVLFMCGYYLMFGVFSSFALGVNLLMLVAVLSLLQATLTLPGIAAIALTLGMAIDANVLINERVREELRSGKAPQQAIHAGYENAWATILDSNVTTLIAGLALLIFGSGPVRGFAVVHCIGILTSMFSAVVVSRGMVNLWYGSKKRLTSVSIGQIWKGGATDAQLEAAK